MISEFTQKVLDWFQIHGRKLPWRASIDPYIVWISEVMLQQTRVETMIPYYFKWLEKFPSIDHLAKAPFDDILTIWEGLGYYRRARLLYQTSEIIVEKYHSKFPTSLGELQQLPGIGKYTAAAIASIAFGLDEPAIDGNIRRVIARVFNILVPAKSIQGEKIIYRLVKENMAIGQAGLYNQSLMDLGALICIPRNPSCSKCPLYGMCQSRLFEVQEQRPISAPRQKIPHYIVTAAIIQKDDKVLIARRPQNGLLGGLWEFPGGKQLPGETLMECLKREIREELNIGITIGNVFGVYKHAYTHYRITLHAFICQPQNGSIPQALQVEDWVWTKIACLSTYPMGKIDRMIAQKLSEGM